MLLLNQTNKLTFTMTVMGTAAAPSARVLIGESPIWSFVAKPAGSEWESLIDLPAEAQVGSTPFKVEVLINGRLFVPINTMIEISSGATASADMEQIDVQEALPLKAPWDKTERRKPETPVPASPALPDTPVSTPPKVGETKSLLSSLERAVKKKPAPLAKQKTDQLTKVKALPISIKEIANATIPSIGIMESAKPAPRVERLFQPPIKVSKGAIIYK